MVKDSVTTNSAEHKTDASHTGQTQSHSTATHETAQHSGGEGSDVFSHLFSELGDHNGLIIGPYKVSELPMIFYHDQFYFYPNEKAMEQAGTFSFHHGHPVLTSTLNQKEPQKPSFDLSITNFVFFQWLAMFLIMAVLLFVSRKFKKNPLKAPSGLQNVVDAFYCFVRDGVVKPNIPSARAVKRLSPYFFTLFFFILVMNMLGLIPGGHTATSTVGVTGALAITAFLVINITAMRESGVGAWFKHLLGGAPIYLAPIMIPIEILSMFIKPFALTIRLFANMVAGHVVLLSLLGLLFYFQMFIIAPAIVGFSVFIYVIELLVVFLQAFIFTMLTAIFTGLAIGEHGHEGHAH